MLIIIHHIQHPHKFLGEYELILLYFSSLPQLQINGCLNLKIKEKISNQHLKLPINQFK